MAETTKLPPFSVHRTFVVQFRAAPDLDRGSLDGRIEHVATQQTAQFQSWAELQGFIERVLMQNQNRPAGAGSPEHPARRGEERCR